MALNFNSFIQGEISKPQDKRPLTESEKCRLIPTDHNEGKACSRPVFNHL